jgi:GH24 family phage-related lysozyme (muramidase)
VIKLFIYMKKWLILYITLLLIGIVSGQDISGVSDGVFLRGDVDGNGVIDISDGIKILNYLFSGGEIRCGDAADTNDNGNIDISDGIYLLNYLFSGGAEVPVPNKVRGFDLTLDRELCGDEWAQGSLQEVIGSGMLGEPFFRQGEVVIDNDGYYRTGIGEWDTVLIDLGFRNGEVKVGSSLDYMCSFKDCNIGYVFIEEAVEEFKTGDEGSIDELVDCSSNDNECVKGRGLLITFDINNHVLEELSCKEQLDAIHLSSAGECALKLEEGYKEGLYNDRGKDKNGNDIGDCTFGYGLKVHDGICDGRESEQEYIGLSPEEAREKAEEKFDEKVEEFIAGLKKIVNVKILKSLSQNQIDALISLVYNIGLGSPDGDRGGRGFQPSNALDRLNEGEEHFEDYIDENGEETSGFITEAYGKKGWNSGGLTRGRREREGEMWKKAEYRGDCGEMADSAGGV